MIYAAYTQFAGPASEAGECKYEMLRRRADRHKWPIWERRQQGRERERHSESARVRESETVTQRGRTGSWAFLESNKHTQITHVIKIFDERPLVTFFPEGH